MYQVDPTTIPPESFGASRALLLRFALASVVWIVSAVLLLYPKLRQVPRSVFDRVILGLWAVSRLGLFVLVFFVKKIPPRGDIVWYWQQANSVLHHQVPYRDFQSSYAPLHSYFDSLLIRVWYTPLAFMVASMVAEFFILLIWLRASRLIFSEARCRQAAILFLGSALSVQFVTVDGQNTVIAGLFVSLAIYCALLRREFLSGLLLGLGIASVKFLPLIYTPVYFVTSSKPWRWAVGLILGCVPIYAFFVHLHAPILRPLSDEGGLRSASNLPFLFESVTGLTLPGHVYDGLLVLGFAIVFFYVLRVIQGASHETKVRALTFGVSTITVILIAMAKKSWSPYFMLALFPVCLAVPLNRTRALLFSAFAVLAVMEQSIWAWWLSCQQAPAVHTFLVTGDKRAIFLLVEVLLLTGLGWLIYLGFQAIRQAASDNPA